jgi:hypothetical protein
LTSLEKTKPFVLQHRVLVSAGEAVDGYVLKAIDPCTGGDILHFHSSLSWVSDDSTTTRGEMRIAMKDHHIQTKSCGRILCVDTFMRENYSTNEG